MPYFSFLPMTVPEVFNGLENNILLVKNDQGEIAVDLEPGDAMVYKGCEIEHWREPYHGIACAQVFYHYTDVNGERFNPWDGRPHGGLPRGMQVSK